jgi:hypothetical protein
MRSWNEYKVIFEVQGMSILVWFPKDQKKQKNVQRTSQTKKPPDLHVSLRTESSIDEKDVVFDREPHDSQVLCECWEMLAPDFHVRHQFVVSPVHNGDAESDQDLM